MGNPTSCYYNTLFYIFCQSKFTYSYTLKNIHTPAGGRRQIRYL
ncbi:hypothetical protein HMPREF1547_00578 [Blautia sp. KLE 1732]|nr:hypothetical protein HMPREF1547_00578 [Blautia sp. KLE 1732]